jgi:hypothetical protein
MMKKIAREFRIRQARKKHLDKLKKLKKKKNRAKKI